MIKLETKPTAAAVSVKSYSTPWNAKVARDNFFKRNPVVGVVLEIKPLGDRYAICATIERIASDDARKLVAAAGFVVVEKTAPLAPGSAKPVVAVALPVIPGPVVAAKAEAPKPAKCGLCATKPEAIAKAREAYGADAHLGDAVDVKKTARGEWYWGPVEVVAPKTSKRASRSAAPSGVKSERAGVGSLPKPGTNAEIIVTHLTRLAGTTKAEVEAALAAKNGKPVSCSIKTDARLFGARLGLDVNETADTDGSARFFLVARGAAAT